MTYIPEAFWDDSLCPYEPHDSSGEMSPYDLAQLAARLIFEAAIPSEHSIFADGPSLDTPVYDLGEYSAS